MHKPLEIIDGLQSQKKLGRRQNRASYSTVDTLVRMLMPVTSHKQETTVAEALVAARKHDLDGLGGSILLCRCGGWFATPDAYNVHRAEAMKIDLGMRAPKRNEVTPELLADVAEAHLSAPDGKRTAAVAKVLGLSNRSAGHYVSLARKAGLLD